VILKPATKPRLDGPATKAWPAGTATGLRAAYDEAAAQTEPGTLLLQELVPGRRQTQFSFAALCDRGRVLASVTAERARQHPPDFGRASTFVVTVDEPEVAELGRRVLAELGLTGLGEVEFKRDPRDGRLLLLDINLRVWGWHTIGRRHGLDFPYLAWRLALGEPVPEVHAPAGLRWLRLTTDLAAGRREVADRTLSPAAYLRSLVGRHDSPVAALDDPLPALAEVPLYALATLARRSSRSRVH
jgi:predicted ATP-grasp superfamily ATP-dependent carboligase